ncbi:MAG: DUF4102 domain-containing protein [Nostoc sp.]|uniref:DUF4102 domain-containing protein n=1 Tax=Nostoc sp. TaxID=1180 RepID=UPI002FF4D06A
MKHKEEVAGQLTLLTVVPAFEPRTAIHDPYWDEIIAPEHPQPEQRWKEADFGEVPHKLDSDGQLTIFYDDSHEPPDPDDYLNLDDYEQALKQWEILVRAQVTSSTVESPVGAQVKLDTKKIAPEHITHWVEKYWVERSGNKYWYYRYCWMSGRKKKRCHLGSVSSIIAKRRKADVEVWIADGKLPCEIKDLIRGWKNAPPHAQDATTKH